MPLGAAWALPAEWEFCGDRTPSVCQCHRRGLTQIAAVSHLPAWLAGGCHWDGLHSQANTKPLWDLLVRPHMMGGCAELPEGTAEHS